MIYETLAKQVVQALNADHTNTYLALSTDEAYPNAAIWQSILNAEAKVINAIFETPGHGRNAGALNTSVPVANGAQVPSHPGRLLGVVIDEVWAERISAAEMSRFTNANARRFNPLKLKNIDHLYAMTGDGRLLFVGGGTATVYYGVYTRPVFADYTAFLAGTMLLPDEYAAACFCLAMQVIGHEGTMIQAMAAYYDRGLRQVAELMGDSSPGLKQVQAALEE